MNDVFKPKSHDDMMTSIKETKIPSYNLSSMIRLNTFPISEERKIRDWCEKVFHLSPREMEVTMLHKGTVYNSIMLKAFGPHSFFGKKFQSNANLKVLNFNDTYFAWPQGKFPEICAELYREHYLRKGRKPIG